MNIQMNAVTWNFLSLLRVFAQSRFINMGDRQNDFQRMSYVGNEKYPQPLSDKFILDIHHALDIQHALENHTTIHDYLRLMFDDGKYLEKADQLNWELKRTPVVFEYHEPVSWRSRVREVGHPVFDHFTITIEASDMPLTFS